MTARLPARTAIVLAAMAALSANWSRGTAEPRDGPPTRAGSGEFKVNTDPGVPGATRPAVATDAVGNFVVVWEGWEPFPFDVEVYGKRYDAEGTPLGPEFRVNTNPVPPARPAVAVDADFDFAVVWTFSDLFGQRYDASGSPVGGEFRVNTEGLGALDPAAVAARPAGGFVAVWAGPSGGSFDIYGQRYDASGTPIGGEFQVNTTTSEDQLEPDIDVAADGSFVVVWQSDAGTADVFGRRYDAAGAPLGGEFQINTTTTDRQHRGEVAVAADGRFVVVWQSEGQDGDGGGIFARRYDAAGNALGGEIPVNFGTTGVQAFPDVGSDASGAFTVVWNGPSAAEFDQDVYLREYDASGTPVGVEVAINSTMASEWRAAIALDDAGDAVVVYERVGSGAFGQVIERADIGLSVEGSCPGTAQVTVSGAPPSSEVAVVAAANTNGFTKGGSICAGTRLDIGEPFQLPPTWVVVDGAGHGEAEIDLPANRCWLQALALEDCTISRAVKAP